jgi:hypothetical protein
VKPEEVAPGTVFRFDGFPNAGPFRMAVAYDKGGVDKRRMYLHNDWVACYFDPADRIIPIED